MGLSIYEPKGDKYKRLFGLESSSCTIDFEWFNWEKISDNEIVLYGLVNTVNSRVYNKEDKDYECKKELVRISLHEKEYEAYKKKLKPKCHESFFFWFLSNLEKSYYCGSLKFSTELDSVYKQIKENGLTDIGGNSVLNIVVNIEKTTLEGEPEKLNTAEYSGGGKTFTPKWKTLLQSFPDYFREMEISSLEHIIDCCLDDFLYGKRRRPDKLPSRETVIKSVVIFSLATDNPLSINDLIQFDDKLKRDSPDNAALSSSASEGTSKDEFDLEGTIAVINTYCKALKLDTEGRKAVCKRLYGKTTLLTMTNEELGDFVKVLEEDLNAA